MGIPQTFTLAEKLICPVRLGPILFLSPGTVSGRFDSGFKFTCM